MAHPQGSRGAAAESDLAGRGSEGKAHGSQWDEGGGAGAIARGYARAAAARRGGAGRRGAGLALA